MLPSIFEFLKRCWSWTENSFVQWSIKYHLFGYHLEMGCNMSSVFCFFPSGLFFGFFYTHLYEFAVWMHTSCVTPSVPLNCLTRAVKCDICAKEIIPSSAFESLRHTGNSRNLPHFKGEKKKRSFTKHLKFLKAVRSTFNFLPPRVLEDVLVILCLCV